MKDPRALQIAKVLKQQGRSKTWLAEQIGNSPQHVSAVLAGKFPMTDRFHAAVMLALGGEPKIADQYRGRVVRVPLSIYNHDPEVAEFVSETYEEAWKADWVREHGAAVLAEAAARAFDRHHQIAAADRARLATRAAS